MTGLALLILKLFGNKFDFKFLFRVRPHSLAHWQLESQIKISDELKVQPANNTLSPALIYSFILYYMTDYSWEQHDWEANLKKKIYNDSFWWGDNYVSIHRANIALFILGEEEELDEDWAGWWRCCWRMWRWAIKIFNQLPEKHPNV